jgi:hypothetical protein
VNKWIGYFEREKGQRKVTKCWGLSLSIIWSRMSPKVTTAHCPFSSMRSIAHASRSSFSFCGTSNDSSKGKRRPLQPSIYQSYTDCKGHRFGHKSTNIVETTRSIEHPIRWYTLRNHKYFSTIPDLQQTLEQQQRQHKQQMLSQPMSNPMSGLSLLADKEDGDDILPHEDNTELWTVPYLDSLAESIRRNVSTLASEVPPLPLDDSKSAQSIQADRSLQERWNAVYRKEIETYRRRMIGPETKSVRPRKKTIDDLWDDSLRSIGIVAKMGDEIYDETKYGGIGMLTPLFGLPVDENLYVQDLERFVGGENEKNSERTTDLEVGEDSEFENDFRQPTSHPHPESWNPSIKDDVNNSERNYSDAILHAIALLRVSRTKDWGRFDVSSSYVPIPDREIRAHETVSCLNSASELSTNPLDEQEMKETAQNQELDDTSNLVSKFLEEVAHRRHATSTLEANLCIAQLITSTSMDSDTILEWCLQIFNEMLLVADTGHLECQPDATTYRLLILSLNKRFMAPGEAIKLCHRMIADETFSVLTPETFMEGMHACREKMDLATGREMMEIAFTKQRVRPPVDSCISFVDMMKTQQLRDEALTFFSRVQQTQMLRRESENKLLLSMCYWPSRTRRGDFVDLAPFLLRILSIVEHKVTSLGERLGLPLWTKLIAGIFQVAKVDHSQMPNVVKAFRILLDKDPHRSLDETLMWIGLETSKILGDSRLAAAIVKQVVDNKRIPSSIGGNDTMAKDKNVFQQSTILPHQAAKMALEICLKEADAQSAETISEILEQLYHTYSHSAQKELLSMILLCNAMIGDSAKAKHNLQTLHDRGMSPAYVLVSLCVLEISLFSFRNTHSFVVSFFSLLSSARTLMQRLSIH